MICPTCHGERYILRGRDPVTGRPARLPCPECGGCGLAHCCEGERTQPEQGASAPQPAAGASPRHTLDPRPMLTFDELVARCQALMGTELAETIYWVERAIADGVIVGVEVN